MFKVILTSKNQTVNIPWNNEKKKRLISNLQLNNKMSKNLYKRILVKNQRKMNTVNKMIKFLIKKCAEHHNLKKNLQKI